LKDTLFPENRKQAPDGRLHALINFFVWLRLNQIFYQAAMVVDFTAYGWQNSLVQNQTIIISSVNPK